MTDSQQQAEWEAWEAKQLAQHLCPASGLPLRLNNPAADGAWPGTLSCSVCDCFGYDPADPRITGERQPQ